MNPQQWYCQIQSTVYGPITSAVLQQWVQEGRIAPTDLIKKEGGQWFTAQGLKGLSWPNSAQPALPMEQPAAEQPTMAPWEQPANEAQTFVPSAQPRSMAAKKLGKSPTNPLALLDWRFEYYLTPWIIRILWILFLVLAVVWFLIKSAVLAWGLLPEMSGATTNVQLGHGLQESPAPMIPPWLTIRVFEIVMYVMWVISGVVMVLVTRMIFETLIVVFRIAEDIGTLKRKYTDDGKP